MSPWLRPTFNPSGVEYALWDEQNIHKDDCPFITTTHCSLELTIPTGNSCLIKRGTLLQEAAELVLSAFSRAYTQLRSFKFFCSYQGQQQLLNLSFLLLISSGYGTYWGMRVLAQLIFQG